MKKLITIAALISLIVGCSMPEPGNTPIDTDNGKLVKIYNDSNIVIYKHTNKHFVKFIYLNKNGGVITN